MSDLTGWKRSQLGQECSIEIGGTPSRNVAEYWDATNELNTWVSIRDLNQSVILHTAESITDAGVKHSNAKLQPEGTILLSFKLSIGRVAIAGCPLYTNEAIAGLRSDSLVHEYLYHGLQQWDLLQGVDQAIKGATLNKKKLKLIEFEFPVGKTEQAKIAQILSTVDQAIEQTEALIAKQERIKTGLMQDLLTRGIDEHGNLRSESTHEFKDSPLGRIPVEWDVCSLEHIGDWSSGGTPPKSNPDYWGSEIPWLCPKDMKTFDIHATIDGLTIAGAKRGSKVMPAQTVFIVVRGMILAHTFPVCISSVPMAFNQDVKAIRTFEHIDSRFLAHWFRSHEHDLLKATTTATHGTKRFEMKDLFDIKIAIPEKEEQVRIIRRFDTLQSEIEGCMMLTRKLSSLKAALMQDLLTGKKRVTPLLELEDAH
jgi:type I restriction enzyme S subunit